MAELGAESAVLESSANGKVEASAEVQDEAIMESKPFDGNGMETEIALEEVNEPEGETNAEALKEVAVKEGEENGDGEDTSPGDGSEDKVKGGEKKKEAKVPKKRGRGRVSTGVKKAEAVEDEGENKRGEEETPKESKKRKIKELSTPTLDRPSRERKTIERFVASNEKEIVKEFTIEKGRGTPLKDIPNVVYKLSKRSRADDVVKLLHVVLYGKRGKSSWIEGLSRYILNAKAEGAFRGISISQVLYITHLLFVDDILIFCDGTSQDIDKVVEGLHLLQAAAGMLVNIDKSSITCSHLSEPEIQNMVNKLPYQTLALDDGLQYLGFHLKPNAYLKTDWRWLIAKLEQRLNGWSHKWLSRAGRLVLIKSVLEAIPVYWLSLSWIPTGVLELIRRLCFAFLWKGTRENRALVWVRWEKIAVPKALGGWGLKNIYMFAKALGAKVSWRLIHTQSLWTRVVYHKYIAPLTLLEWIRLRNKSRTNCSVVWKAVVQHFTLVGSGLVWRIGDGRLLRIGLDPWVGCRGGHVLSLDLRSHLATRGCNHLHDLADQGASTLGLQGWYSARQLGISAELQVEWEDYIHRLRITHIRLTNRTDVLIWAHHPSGVYSPKHGYIQLNVETHNRDLVWWWKLLWKLRCPGKAKLLFWAILENKAPTWDILQKRFLQGPGICPLCKVDEENLAHLFIHCQFSQKVWSEISKILNMQGRWRGTCVLEAFQLWWSDQISSPFRALPCIYTWGIWIARNKMIFQDCRVPMEAVVAQMVAITLHYVAPVPVSRTRPVRVEQIDLSMPWAFFDGASNQQSVCGGGGVLYKSEAHYFHMVAGLGRGTNNFAELMSLKLLMLFALEQGCLSLQIFGDSLIIINWAKEITGCHVMDLLPILEEVNRIKLSFNHITFTHIYRERNVLADQLSKEATQQELAVGTWQITIHAPEGKFNYQHRPFV